MVEWLFTYRLEMKTYKYGIQEKYNIPWFQNLEDRISYSEIMKLPSTITFITCLIIFISQVPGNLSWHLSEYIHADMNNSIFNTFSRTKQHDQPWECYYSHPVSACEIFNRIQPHIQSPRTRRRTETQSWTKPWHPRTRSTHPVCWHEWGSSTYGDCRTNRT